MGSKQEEASLAELAYRILLSHNEPMYYRDIVDEILKIRKIKGKSPYYIVNSCMSQDRRFERIDKGIWGLSKWRYKDISFKYTLTIYCVKNGIITLTSYMRPYFPSEPEEVELTFIDDRGEKISALLNNKLGKIIGFKEWFSKRGLDVNDILVFGISDYEKNIYTVSIPKKEEDLDPDRVREEVLRIVKENKRTIRTGEIIKRLPKEIRDYIKIDDIKHILNREHWLVEVSDNLWVPRELLTEGEALIARINTTSKGKEGDFKLLLKDIFTYFGFTMKEIDFRGTNLYLASAPLDAEGYRFLIEGGTSSNTLPIGLWEEAMEHLRTDYFLYVSYTIPGMVKNPNIIFLSIYTLKKLIQWHDEFPLTLFDFRPLFVSGREEEDRLAEIDKKRREVVRRVSLLKDILNVLDRLTKNVKLIDMRSLMADLNPQKKYTLEEVSEALKFLEVMPVGIVSFTETDSIILNLKKDLAIRRLKSFIDFLIDKK